MSTLATARTPKEPPRAKSGTRRGKRKEYLAERIYKEIRERIYTGIYRAGQHLKEEELVAELGSSRSVVRQALTQLAAERLLEDRPKLGKYVIEFTEEMIAKLVPIRIALEQVAVRQAIHNLTPKDEADLREIAARLRERNLTIAEQDSLDVALHRKIWQMAGNDELEKLLISIVGPFHVVSSAMLVSPYYRRTAAAISLQQVLFEQERSPGGHQLLVDAICRRNVSEAVKAVADHISFSYESTPEEFSKRVGDLLDGYLHRE